MGLEQKLGNMGVVTVSLEKAVNWALRQIGKRNRRLWGRAMKTAEEIAMMDSRAAKWIASDVILLFALFISLPNLKDTNIFPVG